MAKIRFTTTGVIIIMHDSKNIVPPEGEAVFFIDRVLSLFYNRSSVWLYPAG